VPPSQEAATCSTEQQGQEKTMSKHYFHIHLSCLIVIVCVYFICRMTKSAETISERTRGKDM